MISLKPFDMETIAKSIKKTHRVIVVEECMRKDVGPFWVVHGIGTGKLKRGLRNWLATVPYVQKVTDADQIDGGAGCSVVWLQ